MKRALTIGIACVLALLAAAERAESKGMSVVAPPSLEEEHCTPGSPARTSPAPAIGYRPPAEVVGCATLPGGDRVLIADSGAKRSFCPHVAPPGASDGGYFCNAPVKDEFFTQPRRLLEPTAAVHLPGSRFGFGPRDRGRRFVIGIASAEVDNVFVRYRLVGAAEDSAAEATLLRLDGAQAERIGAPEPLTLYVAEIPANRETCAGGEVVARAGWLRYDTSRGLSGLARNLSARDSRCSFDSRTSTGDEQPRGVAESMLRSLVQSVFLLF